jgi:hypothetical protein
MRGTRSPFGLLFYLAFLGPIVPCPPPATGGDLKVVFATDERADKVGIDMEENRISIEKLLRGNVPKSRYMVQQVQIEAFNRDSILKSIDELNVNPDDTILFYYGGHGALDPDRDEAYFLASGDEANEHLYVSRLSEAIQQKGARLAVLVLDCCNNLRPVEGSPRAFFAREPEAQEISPAFERLFFQGQGTILIESSAPGEYALVEPQLWKRQPDGSYAKHSKGSLFTNQFRQVLDDRMRPANSWQQGCRRTQVLMDERFRQLCPEGLVKLGTGTAYPQTKQTIVAVVNGERIPTR